MALLIWGVNCRKYIEIGREVLLTALIDFGTDIVDG
jgi:hypothetical protein